MSIIQAVVLSALQGFTELFPFSSLGIQVVAPHLLHWSIDESSPQFLPFIVSLHVGTALALVIYFLRDWIQLVDAWARSIDTGFRDLRRDAQQKTVWLIIAATVPAGLVGLALHHPLSRLFAAPLMASLLLIVNGLIMAWGDRRLRHGHEDIPSMSYRQAAGIGVAQVLALIPGFSRSGVTIVGGLTLGLSYETAARFSFLMATPIILAAGVLELGKLHGGHGFLLPAVVGGVVSGVVAYLSVRYLMRYFRTGGLSPMAVISVLAGAAFSGLLLLGR